MEVDSDLSNGEIDIDSEYLSKIMGEIFVNDNLRDLKIVAGLDNQKYIFFFAKSSIYECANTVPFCLDLRFIV